MKTVLFVCGLFFTVCFAGLAAKGLIFAQLAADTKTGLADTAKVVDTAIIGGEEGVTNTATGTGNELAGAADPVLSAAAAIACTSFSFGDWSACNSDGTQTRQIISKGPAGCTDTSNAIVKQACVFQGTGNVPCVYTYGLWSTACDSLGMRTRPYTASPAGCLKTAEPVVSEACDKRIPCVSYVYDGWSACGSDGTQTRNILKKSPEGCDPASSEAYKAELKQACPLLPCASYNYSDWSTCTNSIQTRKIISQMPAGCTNTSNAVLKRNCTTVIPCVSYTYSDWSACNGDGTQTRTITAKTPTNCNNSATAELKRVCQKQENTDCKSYAYGEWSECGADGIQTRKVLLADPAGCRGGVEPVLQRQCMPPADPCGYVYSDWGNCEADGFKSRKLISAVLPGCQSSPVLEQKCNIAEVAGNTENGISTVISETQKNSCFYSYSNWGACVANLRTRMLISAAPSGCDKSVAPELSQACDSLTDNLPMAAADAPAPVPESMLVAAEEPVPANLNGRTSIGWQNYYFGAQDCRDAALCAGAADPDNDSLINDDEYRFGTNPMSPDTDRDGRVDADEIIAGRNPLVASFAPEGDVVVYGNPKETGREAVELYRVKNIEQINYDDGRKELKITGQGLPNSYVSIYIYSDKPVILTVKTDSEGNWVYILDKPMQEGDHEIYVVVNDNEGKVAAKSTVFSFIQTAEAASANYPRAAKNLEKAPTPAKSRLGEGYLIFFVAAFVGLMLALAAIGLARSIGGARKDQ